MLPSTEAYNNLLQECKEKEKAIWPEFYSMDTMMCREWTRANYKLRHLMMRIAVQGFHHLVCKNKECNQPEDQCICVLFEKNCDRYHIVLICAKRPTSLTNF